MTLYLTKYLCTYPYVRHISHHNTTPLYTYLGAKFLFLNFLWSSSVPIPSISLLFGMIDDHWTGVIVACITIHHHTNVCKTCGALMTPDTHQWVKFSSPNFSWSTPIPIPSICSLLVVVSFPFQGHSHTNKMRIPQNNGNDQKYLSGQNIFLKLWEPSNYIHIYASHKFYGNRRKFIF